VVFKSYFILGGLTWEMLGGAAELNEQQIWHKNKHFKYKIWFSAL